MKKVFLLAATVFTLAAFQSCSKCGHCVTTTTYTSGSISTTSTTQGPVYCGNNANESGSYSKAAKLQCEKWPSDQEPDENFSYSSSWETDK
ncbi:MAG: hypothetical protein V4615_11395 [Bacteroidota bacterium]